MALETKGIEKSNVTIQDHQEEPFFDEPEHPKEQEVFGGNDEETVNTFNKFSLDGNNQLHISIHGQQKESLFEEQEHSNEQQMGDGNDEELADYVHDTRKAAVAIAPAAATLTTGDNVDDEYQQEYVNVGDE